MVKNNLDFALRISVVDKCNFSCLYCPRNTTMENFCPEDKKDKILPTEDFIVAIESLLDKYNFSKVVVTGGEPMLADDLPDILKVIKNKGQFVELDTNGSLFNEEKWISIKSFINAVKMSLDSIDENTFKTITRCKTKDGFSNANQLINACIRASIPITLNIVATKMNYHDIEQVINFAKTKKINTSLLDLYYTKETQEFWLKNYIHLEDWVDKHKHEFENTQKTGDFGCGFLLLKYNDGKNSLRVKLSEMKTMRDDFCDNCEEYCQEGIFALRLSRQGWVTSCQANNGIGAYYKHFEKIENLVKRINNTYPSTVSFEKLLKFYNLKI